MPKMFQHPHFKNATLEIGGEEVIGDANGQFVCSDKLADKLTKNAAYLSLGDAPKAKVAAAPREPVEPMQPPALPATAEPGTMTGSSGDAVTRVTEKKAAKSKAKSKSKRSKWSK